VAPAAPLPAKGAVCYGCRMEGGSQHPVLAGALGVRPAASARRWPASFRRLWHPGRLSCALFVLVIAAALPLGLKRSELDFRLSENRLPSPPPPLAQVLGDPKTFVHGAESAVADRVALRKVLIGIPGYLKWKLGVGANTEVIVGHDGWMFNFCIVCLDDMRGTAPRRPELAGPWTALLDELRDYAEARGIHMTAMVVPRKEAVYRELLPDWVKGPGRHTNVGHFLEAARATPLDVIYPLEELRARTSDGKLYFKYDHHFTALGAREATEILLQHLHDRYGMPVKHQDYDAVPILSTTGPLGDRLSLAVLQGIPWLREPDHHLLPRGGPRTILKLLRDPDLGIESTTDDPTLPTLVMYGDSFLGNWVPLIAPHFRRAVFVLISRGGPPLDHFPTSWIDQEKPDFLVYERWEHGLAGAAGS